MDEIIKRGYDLTERDPNRKEASEYKSPETLLSGIIEKEKPIGKILR